MVRGSQTGRNAYKVLNVSSMLALTKGKGAVLFLTGNFEGSMGNEGSA